MMNKYLLGSILALLGWTGIAQAQVALGTPVSPETYPEPVYGPYAPAVYPPSCRSECKPKPTFPILGHIARTVMRPIRTAAGHLLPPCCAEPMTKDEVARMVSDGGYSPAELTAAKIKIDESQATARRAAVKYLATIDCHYYPEVESGLIAALRADRVESVRFEAAMAVGSCRGMTEKMLEALNMTALSVELDGNPAETSERVRGAARASLHRCACRGLCVPPDPQPTATIEPPVPVMDWWTPDPGVIQPTACCVPAANPPVVLPVSQQERDRAETVSAKLPGAARANEPRSLYQFLLGFATDRKSEPQSNVDPRLRGLSPLGSEMTLAIPTSPPITPAMRYNNPE